MVVLNAVMYRDEFDDVFVAQLCDFDQVSTGKTREAALADLEKCVVSYIDFARSNPDLSLLRGIGGEGEKYWQRAIMDNLAPSSSREVGGYTLHIYDFSEERVAV